MFPYVLPKKIGGLTAILILNSNPSAADVLFNSYCSTSGVCPTYYIANTNILADGISTGTITANIGTYIQGCADGTVYRLAPSGPGSQNAGGRCMFVPTCTECEDGYTLQDGELPLRIEFQGSEGWDEIRCTTTGGREYKVCERNSTEPDPDPGNCVSDTTWVAHTVQGYEKRTTRTWNGTRCVESTQYRCAASWYGSPGTTATGCQHCPGASIGVWNPTTGKVDGKVVEGKSAPGSRYITNCYIEPYTSADISGIFDYTSNCGWVQ